MSPVVFVPHPDTRECPKHPGQFEIPNVRECVRCLLDRLLRDLYDRLTCFDFGDDA